MVTSYGQSALEIGCCFRCISLGDCSAISPAILIAPHRDGLPFFFSFPETRLYLTQAVIGPDGSISHLFGALATQVMGQSIRMERCDQPNLLDVGRAYSRALVAEGWKGPVNVQMKCTPTGDFVPFELNGRFTGGTAARTLLGFDEVAEAIARFLPVADFPSRPGAVAEIVQNYLASYGIYSARGEAGPMVQN